MPQTVDRMDTRTPETLRMDEAAQRLGSALERFEDRLDHLFERIEGLEKHDREVTAMKSDRARLARDLDAARAREQELQRLADDASRVLGAAIIEVRDTLGKV